jgi:hypothetical protein
MLVKAEIVAARLTRLKTLIDAVERTCLERGCLENEATRETFLMLKQELDAARISVRRRTRPTRP